MLEGSKLFIENSLVIFLFFFATSAFSETIVQDPFNHLLAIGLLVISADRFDVENAMKFELKISIVFPYPIFLLKTETSEH